MTTAEFLWTLRGKHGSMRAMTSTLGLLAAGLASGIICCAAAAETPPVFPLWPDKVPGETNALGEEKDMTKTSEGLVAGKTVIRLGNVSTPTLTMYRAPKDKDTGAAVVVFPGGDRKSVV